MFEQERSVINENKLDATKADSLFRESVDRRDRFPLINNIQSNVDLVFFAPLNGQISQTFDPTIKHFAVDILANTGAPVKAIADGTVIFSGWTLETGYVIYIQHEAEIISVYKHNSELLKNIGEKVKAGEGNLTGFLFAFSFRQQRCWPDAQACS